MSSFKLKDNPFCRSCTIYTRDAVVAQVTGRPRSLSFVNFPHLKFDSNITWILVNTCIKLYFEVLFCM